MNKHLKNLNAIKITSIKQWMLKNKAKLRTGVDSGSCMKRKRKKEELKERWLLSQN